MSRSLGCIAAAILIAAAPLQAQDSGDTVSRRSFLGSSAFVLFNFLLAEPPDFYQLNYGYWVTSRDVVSVEAVTWKYGAPLGIPYGHFLFEPGFHFGLKF